MLMLIGRLAEDGFVVFFTENSNFVKSKKDAYMSLQPAHFIKLKCELKETLKSRLVNC